MDPRGLITFVSIAIGTYPLTHASALGLGDATLRSRLNEPLAVEIDLVGAPSQPETLNATVGADATTEGKPGVSSRLRPEITVDATGRHVIRITTERSVREPVIRFLLVVESAREHVMREYTLLLDPPGYSLPTRPVREPPPAARPEAVSTTSADSPPVSDGHARRIGPVARGDTLSRLAIRYAPDAGVSWAQMTWALFEANPGAFIDGDIDKLRLGANLNVPPREALLRHSHREAVALITAGEPRQPVAETPAFAAHPPTAPPPLIPAPEVEATAAVPPPVTAPETTAEPSPAPPQPLFRVLSPGDTNDAGTVGPPASPREQERLRQLIAEANRQIRDSHEEMARSRRQLADTAKQITTLVATVERKDSQIQNLETRLAELRAYVEEQRAAVAGPESGWLQRLLIEILILATLVVLLAVTFYRWTDARRRAEAQGASDDFASALPLTATDHGPGPVKDGVRVPPQDAIDENRADVADEPTAGEPPPEEEADYEEIVLQGDPLMEANAYLAYGYHEKAREVLEALIKENPAHAESRLSMLRVLHALKEKRKFRRHAEALLELVDDRQDERWIEAARLGRAVLPEERLFDESARGRAEDEPYEQTIWTGTRPEPVDTEDHVYLDLDEFKYVDLFLQDEAPDADESESSEPSIDLSAEVADEETEAELARWTASLARKREERSLPRDPDAPPDPVGDDD